LSSLSDDPLNLFVAVYVWWLSPTTVRQQLTRWDFRARIGEAPPFGEAAHNAQAVGPGRRLRVRRLSCPAESELRGRKVRSFAFEELNEAPQLRSSC
jgi:hypothetical protein